VSIHRSYTEDRAFFNPVLEAMCLYTASILNNVPCATHMTHKKIRLRGDSPRDDVSVHRFDTEHRALRNVHDTKKVGLRGGGPRGDVSVHRFDTEHHALCNVHDTQKNGTQRWRTSKQKDAGKERFISRQKSQSGWLERPSTVPEVHTSFPEDRRGCREGQLTSP